MMSKCQACATPCVHCSEAPIRSALALALVSPAIVVSLLWLVLVALYLWVKDVLKGNKDA